MLTANSHGMHRLLWFKFLVSFFFFAAVSPLLCQVRPAVSGGMSSISVGSAFAVYNVDLGPNRMDGVTVWSDWQPGFVPPPFRGIGLELEVRDINMNSSPTAPSVYRMETFGGGPMYTWNRYPRIRPYAKFIMSYGEIDWSNPNPLFRHETRTVYAPGGGFDAHVYRHIWFRADYEYQFWANIAGTPDTINPHGFNFGVSYHLNHLSPEE